MTKQDAIDMVRKAYPDKRWIGCIATDQPESFDVLSTDGPGFLAIVDELGVSLLKVIEHKEFN